MKNNLVLGKVNKFLLPYAKKIFVAYETVEGIPVKYKENFLFWKYFKARNIKFKNKAKNKTDKNGLNILILGGSQAAKIFGDKLRIFLLN